MAIRSAGPGGGTLNGTSGQDVLWGRGGNDIINGLGSSDYITGGDGNDLLRGGAGADVIRGNAGQDRLFGDSGSDSMSGGSGNDLLVGGTGADILEGGAGNDAFQFRASHGTEVDVIEDFRVGEDQIVLGDGLRVVANETERLDIDLDGSTDTVLTLTNGATIVLLDVGGRQDWSLAGPNVMTLAEFNLLS